MPIGIRPGEIKEYVLAEERDRQGTVFLLKTLSGLEAVEIFSEEDRGRGMFKTVSLGVAGWRNMADDRGEEIQFIPGRAADFIPYKNWGELANAILDIIIPSETQKKS